MKKDGLGVWGPGGLGQALAARGVRATASPQARKPTRPLLLLLILLSGCSYLRRGEQLAEPIDLIAVLPIMRNERSLDKAGIEPGDRIERLATDAEKVVTAQIYRVLSHD